MLEYNQIKERTYIDLEGIPYEVISSHVFRKQQRKPVNKTKIRNLITKRVIEKTFHQNEKATEAIIGSKKIKYLYNNKDKFWFCKENNPKNRFSIPENIVGVQGKFIKENCLVKSITFNDEIIGLKVPIKVELKVIDAPPGEKGNTAQGGSKQVTLETGAQILVPLFINEGDLIRINTESGEYSERAQK